VKPGFGAAMIGYGAGILFTLLGVTLGKLLATPDITHAIGVISQCGIYAVATIDSLGGVEVYDAAREAPAAVEALVNALPEGARTAVLVPCPLPELFSDGPTA
jgi:hypothetical protein